jgi:hypothetical protein
MVKHRARCGALALLGLWLALTMGTATASAQDATPSAPSEATVLEARSLFDEGVRLSRAERWLEALDAFRRSSQLVERPRTYFNLAIALDRLGRSRESIAAIDRYLALSDPSADDADRREAARMRLASERRLATLVLHVSPADASLEIDGEPVSGEGADRHFTWDPGDHVVTVQAAGHEPFRETLALTPGAQLERVITLAASATSTTTTTVGPETERALELAPPPEPERGITEDPVFWIVIGAVAVAVGVGVGVGIYLGTEPQPYGGSTGIRF